MNRCFFTGSFLKTSGSLRFWRDMNQLGAVVLLKIQIIAQQRWFELRTSNKSVANVPTSELAVKKTYLSNYGQFLPY